MIADFELDRPGTVDEALAAIADGGTPYCGGTELVAAMQLGLLAPERLVDLKRIPELSGIAGHDGGVTVGAATRHRQVSGSPLIARQAPILAQACAQLGNQRVRATGSVGGNLCFAEPRSDVATALFALRAQVTLRGPGGTRTLPVPEFTVDAMETARAEDELLVSVRIPAATAAQVYLRFQPAEYPTACVALAGGTEGPAGDGVRVVVGAVGDRAQPFDFAGVRDVDAAGIAAELDITEDANGADDYKRHLSKVLIERAVRAWKEADNA